MTLSPQWLEELRSRVTLSTLIGRTVKVQKAGREYKACCPFHNEKTPSFTINDEKGFYHCLAGETGVITANGVIPIEKLSGQTAEILSRDGQWLPAQFKSYGKQKLWEISLSRNRVSKTLFATSGHRWFVRGRKSAKLTSELKPGDRLQTTSAPTRDDWTLDPEGVRHGIMFGDGTLYDGKYGTINLHGEKDHELRQWFPGQEHHIHEREGGHLYLRVYGGKAFGKMKQIPARNLPDAYLLGFIAGYLAADGHVAKDGTVMLNSADSDALESVRDIAMSLGITTYGRTTQWRAGYGQKPSEIHRIHFVTSSLSKEIFLLNKARQRFAANRKQFSRLRWTVVSVEESSRHETVYCAEVPIEHAFALEDNILTGNCFGCAAHGDAISWMTEQRGLGFMDAVKELAAEAQMEVPAPDPRAAQRQEVRATLHDVMAAAQDWFVTQFNGIDGAHARDYLKNRGISEKTIREFGFGFAPDSRGRLKDALSVHGIDQLIEAGLLIKVDDKEPYDRFRGRLMIPIRDPRGRVIAFGGRILGDGEPKYLNSPDTPLFDKGRTLYNLDKASPASRQTGRILVVEGYMDAIALAQAGFADVVAPLGTALTEHQIERIWKMVEAPILCFDGDNAGQKAAMRAALRALPILRPSHSLNFISLPAGQDPDDLIRSDGAHAFAALIAKPQMLDEKIWQVEYDAEPLNTPETKAGLKKRLADHVRDIAHQDIAQHYRQAFDERYQATFFARNDNHTAGRRSPNNNRKFPSKFVSYKPMDDTKAYLIEGYDLQIAKGILGGLIRHPSRISGHFEELSAIKLADSQLQALLGELINIAMTKETLDMQGLLTILEKTDCYNVAKGLLRADALNFTFNRKLPDDAPSLLIERAHRDLAEAILVVTARPGLEAALAEATRRVQDDLTEESYAEQQRLREAKQLFHERLVELTQIDD